MSQTKLKLQLSDFASFLKQNCIEALVEENTNYLREMDLIGIRYFKQFSKNKFNKMCKAGLLHVLNLLETGKPIDNFSHIFTDDTDETNRFASYFILRIFSAQKQAILASIPKYTSDTPSVIKLVQTIEYEYTKAQEQSFIESSGKNISFRDKIPKETLYYEDFQLANEELQVINEELRITNEELEVSKDELHRQNIEMQNLYESLNLERERLRKLIKAIPGMIWEFHGKPNSTQKYMNYVCDYVENMFGYSVQDWLTTSDFWFKIIHPEDKEFVVKEFENIFFAGGNPGSVQFRCVTRDNLILWVETFAVSSCDENGTPAGMIGVAMDITKHKESEAELNVQKKELKRSNKDLQDFASIISHDLQEPVRSVKQYMLLLSKKSKERFEPETQEFISFALEGALKIETMIRALLDYSRLDKKKDIKFISCEKALKQALQSLCISIDECRAEITYESLPKIKGDYFQIVQLFQNLLSNSIKYCRNPIPKINITAELKNNEWLFSVMDNGIGIEEKDYERIFQLFQRLHTQKEYSGTGVGLSVCKKIVERYGGTIWVDSKSGEGSVFHFTLPV